MNPTLETIYTRRSIRKFEDKPVTKAVIEQIIDAGRMAPSAMNRQPWHFIVVTDKDRIEQLSKGIAGAAQKFFDLLHGVNILKSADVIFHGAPVVIFISAPDDNHWAGIDTGACIQNMMLAARSLGLDTCPIGLARHVEKTKLLSTLNVPKGHRVQLAIIVGYGAEKGKLHKRKKNNVQYA